ncbi:hypothetical protein EXIGLDRAFT_612554 [Exidia glandulosa HHB12029]|uniref:Bicarbonate transporter-like transmembrane domain-containing protein n=1 Tax=Exidia glandulosa HHB12029 TaxID=1314781 RepID=A0A165IRN0_EXIGL|nr:hypothetical protein EXIGLDRAFT_612554 [Exidia glandulosa HHB12029]
MTSTPRTFVDEKHADQRWHERSWAYQLRPFRGMLHDVRRRLPWYLSDWTTAFHKANLYRVLAASLRMFFLNLAPAVSYLLDMNRRTGGTYGINEVLLASALPLVVFSIFSVQPLTIVGVTGLINLFNYTNYDIVTRYEGVDYLQFQAWMLIWAAIFHILGAIFNFCDFTRFITDMTSTTFGLYVGVIYIQKGIELLVFEFSSSAVDGWLAVLVAVLFTVIVYLVERAGQASPVPFWLRKFIWDYGFICGIIFFAGFVHIPGHLKDANLSKLPITKAFFPSTERSWVVPFWELSGKWVAVAIPFGFLLTLLFYFDHNVSSLMAQARHFPVERPAGFHWDFFLLGITTLVSGILGLPAPNGLVPQAPVHTESLSVMKLVQVDGEEREIHTTTSGTGPTQMKVVRTRVVEQRVSHLVMGLLTLGTMTRPLLVVLGLMPRALFAGIFILVGWASIEGNPIIHNSLFLLRERRTVSLDHPLLSVPKKQIAKFLSAQWFVFGASVAISQTVAAIGFPLIFIALIPVRYALLPRWFTERELALLDAPTANAPDVLQSIGGELLEINTDRKLRSGDATPKAPADVEVVAMEDGSMAPVVHSEDVVAGVGSAR